MKITKDDVGRKVWDYLRQEWGEISHIENNWVSVYFNNELRSYLTNGTRGECEKLPRLFWQEVPPIEEPPKPKRMVKKGVRVWVAVNSQGEEIEASVIGPHDAFNKAGPHRVVELTGTVELEEE